MTEMLVHTSIKVMLEKLENGDYAFILKNRSCTVVECQEIPYGEGCF